MVCSDGLQHRSSWPVNNSIPVPPSYLSSMPPDVGPYSLTASGYPLQHSADGMVSLPSGSFHICSCILFCCVLFCSLAILDPRVGLTMKILSPFIFVLCHCDWLFHGESCPRLDVVKSGPCMVFLTCMHLTLFLALHFYTTHSHTRLTALFPGLPGWAVPER